MVKIPITAKTTTACTSDNLTPSENLADFFISYTPMVDVILFLKLNFGMLETGRLNCVFIGHSMPACGEAATRRI